jgi:hypothetical protein
MVRLKSMRMMGMTHREKEVESVIDQIEVGGSRRKNLRGLRREVFPLQNPMRRGKQLMSLRL